MTSNPTGVLPLPDEARQIRDLLSQVAWFNRLRLIAAAGVIWLTALATHVLSVVADPWPLYSLGALIAFVDGCYMLFFDRLSGMSLQAVRRHVFLQIAIDLIILTALLHYTGGVTNPLVMFYMFHAFIAALVLSIQAAVVVALCALLLVAALGFAERMGWIEHQSLGLGLLDLWTVKPMGFALLLLAYGLTMVFSIYFVATVLRRLRANEKQLVRLGRTLAMSEKLASIGTLAAGVSHEINNPVAVINNKVQILRYRIDDGDERPKLLAELDVIDKHTRRIGQITDGLLTFSRETPFEIRRLDMSRLVREAVDLVRVPFRAAEVEIEMEQGGPLVVQGSSNHLLQVLVNMLLNAKDASVAGGSVQVAWEERDGEAILSIVDHGQGVAPEHLAKIFDPFFTTKDVDKGTGLGLAISHGIVERHGGRIEVESESGRGAAFRIFLRVATKV
ncbi:MAG: ATP-binding protein [Planctomycetota bacterium]|nr:ATP-binding protein [Planctomycetota bacterium]